MFKNVTMISSEGSEAIKHLKVQWPQLSAKEQAHKVEIYCCWHQIKEALWCIQHANRHVLAYDNYDALKSCVENNHLNLAKAFAERDAIPSGNALADTLRLCNTKHHTEMAVYFIDELKVDITGAPEVLGVYLLAKGLSPMEYLQTCPDKHKKACLSMIGTPVKKGTQKLGCKTIIM